MKGRNLWQNQNNLIHLHSSKSNAGKNGPETNHKP